MWYNFASDTVTYAWKVNEMIMEMSSITHAFMRNGVSEEKIFHHLICTSKIK